MTVAAIDVEQHVEEDGPRYQGYQPVVDLLTKVPQVESQNLFDRL